MRTRKSQPQVWPTILMGFVVVIALIAINITIGAWATQYVVAYWTHFFRGVTVHLPYFPAAIAALFCAEAVIPAAIFTWILSFIL